jgi:DNA-cytosine methyltransferase
MMRILSLFDGISCARVAAEKAGFVVESYYASEIDKYAIQVAKKNYPDTIHLGSVTGINGLDYQGVDLLIGGSPCQDLSIAKKDRKGLDGNRSSLFWEYVRILKEVKPKYFLLENVNSMPKEAKAIITEAVGVEPIMINAALVSAQNRKRLFWTNIPGVTQPEDRNIYLKDILESGDPFLVEKQGKLIVKHLDKSITLMARDYKGFGNQGMTGVAVNVPQSDKSYCIPSTYYKENCKSLLKRKKTGLYVVGAASRTYPRIPNGEPRSKQIELRKDEKSNSLTSVQGDSLVATPLVIRKLTPIECERLQSLPDNYTDGISNTQRYKCLGNAFNVDVVAHILGFIK